MYVKAGPRACLEADQVRHPTLSHVRFFERAPQDHLLHVRLTPT